MLKARRTPSFPLGLTIARVCVTDDHQVVHLPKGVLFDGDEAIVNKHGKSVTLVSQSVGWQLFRQAIEQFPADYMRNRKQPKTSDSRARSSHQ